MSRRTAEERLATLEANQVNLGEDVSELKVDVKARLDFLETSTLEGLIE